MMIARGMVILMVAMATGCVVVQPRLPSPANVRRGLNDLSPKDKERVLNPQDGDIDAIVLRADHEFLACGGDQVGSGYKYVLQNKPDHIRANLGMGEWYVCHRKYTEAVPYLRKVLSLADGKSQEYVQAKGVLRYVENKLRTTEANRLKDDQVLPAAEGVRQSTAP